MIQFGAFKTALQKHFDYIVENSPEVFYTAVPLDKLWDTYLASFPDGTNPVYKERTEHDCQCCKQFIRNCGAVVGYINGELVSLWDVEIEDPYDTVAVALSELVKSFPIENVYRHFERTLGTDHNHQQTDSGVLTWEHFYQKLPPKLYLESSIPTYQGKMRTNKEILQRSMEEISVDAANIVLELIEQNSLYRGEEHRNTIQSFIDTKTLYDYAIDKDTYSWILAANLKEVGRYRNTVIGTLLTDLSDGVDLEKAVKAFEFKVAPANYKRPTALITKGMIQQAQKKVEELGIQDALERRYAVIEDITVNNVLFADRSARKAMGDVFDELEAEVADKVPNLDKIEEVSIIDFMNNILPKATSVEVMVENKHANNFVSLIAPVNPDANNILKWNNNFSWSYNGEVTDSIKEKVKSAGGNVTGDLRFSLAWSNYDDLDLHIIEPNGNEIYYADPVSYRSKGELDVDMNAGGRRSMTPVENIFWKSKSKLQEGRYKVFVNQYTKRESEGVGFQVEMEFEGNITTFEYPQDVRQSKNVVVVEFSYSHKDGIRIIKSLPSSTSSKEIWGVNTHKFHRVSTIMHSPNHWDEEQTGNKHWFFMLDGCVNPNSARGFYNEFLSGELTPHRKVFEVLSSKMKTEKSDNQLSGVGFSSTKRDSILCRVKGSFNRIVKINF